MEKWEKKEETFTVLRGKKYHFGKKEGAKMSYFGQIFNPWSVTKINCLRRKMVPAMEKNLLANINLDKKEIKRQDARERRKFNERKRERKTMKTRNKRKNQKFFFLN